MSKSQICVPVILILVFVVIVFVLWKYWGKDLSQEGKEEGSGAEVGRWSRWASGMSKVEQVNAAVPVHQFDTSEVDRINAFFAEHDSLKSQQSEVSKAEPVRDSQLERERQLISTYDEVISLISRRDDDLISKVEISLPVPSPEWVKSRAAAKNNILSNSTSHNIPKTKGIKNKRIPKFMDRGNGPESEGEYICRDVLEAVYGLPFPKAHPDWLKNPETGGRLELDCYNEELGIAVEYNGVQHYKWPNGFKQSLEEFQQQLRRDQYKREVCESRGIYYIVVPYKVPAKDIPAYLYDLLPENT